MTKKLTFRETIFVASMLFGMFFGAGNLIFPVSMGQMAGSHIWQAAAGFLITGVGLPLLGIVPEDEAVPLAAAAGAPLALYTGKGASLACLHMARRLLGIRQPFVRL